jgi:hypothetical protein
MGYNPHEHVCELFDFECMRENDRKVYMWKDFNQQSFFSFVGMSQD